MSRILRCHEIAKQIKLHPRDIYQMVRDRKFPEPIKFGNNAVGWRQEQINEWKNKDKNV